MKTINMHEAKTHLSRIVDRVTRGESFIIGKAGKPMAILSPFVATVSTRKPGSLKGKIRIADDFDAADEELADLFDGLPGE